MLLSLVLSALALPTSSIKPPQPIHEDTWIRSDDYPSDAVVKTQEGQTYFSLVVRPNGSVAKCDFQSGPKSNNLGKRGCSTLLRQAKFFPATDEVGHPVTSVYKNVINWIIDSRYARVRLPDLVLTLQSYPPKVNIRTRAEAVVMVEPDSTISSCALTELAGPTTLQSIICEQIKKGWHPLLVLGDDGKPVRSVQPVEVGFESLENAPDK